MQLARKRRRCRLLAHKPTSVPHYYCAHCLPALFSTNTSCNVVASLCFRRHQCPRRRRRQSTVVAQVPLSHHVSLSCATSSALFSLSERVSHEAYFPYHYYRVRQCKLLRVGGTCAVHLLLESIAFMARRCNSRLLILLRRNEYRSTVMERCCRQLSSFLLTHTQRGAT